MGEQAENLNYDCNYNMFLAKIMLSSLPRSEDRQKAVKWMKKLTTCNRSLEEMKLRNDFMYYLVVNIQQGELNPPFTENPPAAPLPSLAHLLSGSNCKPDYTQVQNRRGVAVLCGLQETGPSLQVYSDRNAKIIRPLTPKPYEPGGVTAPGEGGDDAATEAEAAFGGAGGGGKKAMLYEQSPDGGAFLAAQPVPRCGAFCYLAVVAREPNKD